MLAVVELEWFQRLGTSVSGQRRIEAEERMKETPTMLKTPSGYVQQSPWLSVANKQLELMARFMSELGIAQNMPCP